MSHSLRILHAYHEDLSPAVEKVNTTGRSQALLINVIFTTIADTLEALREAGRLAFQLGARIRVLVPSVVPYPLDLNRPRADPLFRLRQFRTICDQHSVDTSIDVRLCRDRMRCIREALTPCSLVLIGGRNRSWPWLSEKVLARKLQRDGHEVILIEARS